MIYRNVCTYFRIVLVVLCDFIGHLKGLLPGRHFLHFFDDVENVFDTFLQLLDVFRHVEFCRKWSKIVESTTFDPFLPLYKS